jgi:hypothetical protein
MDLLPGLIVLRGVFQDPPIWIGEYIDHIVTAAAPSPIVTCAQSSPPLASTVFMFHLLWTYIAALPLLYTTIYLDRKGQYALPVLLSTTTSCIAKMSYSSI